MDLTYDLQHAEVLGKFQSILELTKENLNWIWNSFSREDQKIFLEKYQSILKENSNPMPPRTAKLIIDHIEKGQIEIKKGWKTLNMTGINFVLNMRMILKQLINLILSLMLLVQNHIYQN